MGITQERKRQKQQAPKILSSVYHYWYSHYDLRHNLPTIITNYETLEPIVGGQLLMGLSHSWKSSEKKRWQHFPWLSSRGCLNSKQP